MDLPIKDKIAVVFHAITGGIGGRNGVGEPVNISNCAKTIKYYILSRYDCDIFMHSWSVDKQEELESLYNPVASQFQPQESFGFPENVVKEEGRDVNPFSLLSRFTSLERAMKLKQDYELSNGFKYKWVLVLRYDLVFFTEMDITNYDNNNIYICCDVAWIGEDMKRCGCVLDFLFLSSSEMMDEFSRLATEIKSNVFGVTNCAHHLSYRKIMSMFNDINKIKFLYNRYDDVEIYRLIMNPGTHHPDQSEETFQKQQGMKDRYNILMEKLSNMQDLPIKDKIAVIFHGIVGGLDGVNGVGSSINIYDCAKTIKYNFLSHNNCDIFMHSWSVDKAEELKSLYNPVVSLFQPQEYFGFNEEQARDSYGQHSHIASHWRLLSLCTSVERGIKLKQDYEIINRFRYKWVILFRYDLILFKKLDISTFDNNNFYVVDWGEGNILEFGDCIMDYIFLCNSEKMDEIAKLPAEINNKTYDPSHSHKMYHKKLMNMFNNDTNKIKSLGRRFKDVEIYRHMINPGADFNGSYRLGILEMKGEFEELLKKINNEQ